MAWNPTNRFSNVYTRVVANYMSSVLNFCCFVPFFGSIFFECTKFRQGVQISVTAVESQNKWKSVVFELYVRSAAQKRKWPHIVGILLLKFLYACFLYNCNISLSILHANYNSITRWCLINLHHYISSTLWVVIHTDLPEYQIYILCSFLI
jgi:hypothetical protein